MDAAAHRPLFRGRPLWAKALIVLLAIHKELAAPVVYGGVADAIKGEVPVGLVVLKSGVAREQNDISEELIRLVRERIGPVASFKQCVVVKRLPKTRSGKIVRGTIKRIADGRPGISGP